MNDKAFNQLQTKLLNTNAKLSEIKGQITEKEFEENRAKITLREIDTLAPTAATYQRVGRMFVLTEQEELRQQLQATLEKSTQDLVTLRSQLQYTEHNLQDLQKNLQELFRSSRS